MISWTSTPRAASGLRASGTRSTCLAKYREGQAMSSKTLCRNGRERGAPFGAALLRFIKMNLIPDFLDGLSLILLSFETRASRRELSRTERKFGRTERSVACWYLVKLVKQLTL